MSTVLDNGLRWYTNPAADTETCVCPMRDLFLARLDTMYRSLLRAGHLADDVALLTAVVGEIGNNSFDHNVGQWHNTPGCWFQYARETAIYWIVVADHGQGMLASLRRVDPQLESHQAAVDTAFRKRLSGRAPEQRGNGLKFVRGVINGHPHQGLWCVSGDGMLAFGGMAAQIVQAVSATYTQSADRGTCVILGWRI